jgi:Putative Ig domain
MLPRIKKVSSPGLYCISSLNSKLPIITLVACFLVQLSLPTFSYCVEDSDNGLVVSHSDSDIHEIPAHPRLLVLGTMPAAHPGVTFQALIKVIGGTAPYKFSIVRGVLPGGLQLDAANGSISGTPAGTGTYEFTVVANDSKNVSGDRRFAILVSGPSVSKKVTISPTGISVPSGGTQQFSAVVSGTANTAVKWSASAGTVSSSGLFTAPAVTTNRTVVVVATSAADSGVKDSIMVTVTGKSSTEGSPTTGSPSSAVTVAISAVSTTMVSGSTQQLTATVTGTSNPAVTWSASSGSISPSGVLTAPVVSSSQSVTAVATSVANPNSAGSLTVLVTSSAAPVTPPPPPPTSQTGPDNRYCGSGDVPAFGSSDGPALPPAACFYTAQAATPSLGSVIQVPAGGNIQTALSNANCGDTLVLQAGQTYSGFTLNAKNCDAAHYITIETSAINSLPAEGNRATPCYAGVSSLPSRPSLNCTSTSIVMARIAGSAGQSNVISNTAGADHYRLIGLEIADTGANGSVGGFYDLVLLNSADHIIFDRCWVHGSTTGEDVKGVDFENSTYIAVIDSYISDIHSKLSVYGADSSAVGSVTGTGPVKVVDNFLESAGNNILWGGGASSTNISDIEIRRNHMFKPFTWWQQSASYFGTAFEVKNLFENKSGIRELVEGNIFEDVWAQAQNGPAVLLYPKNQYGQCPNCTLHDVTFRYNYVAHAANGMIIAVSPATTCPGQSGNGTGSCNYPSGPAYNFSIHDNVFDDINQPTYSPTGCCTDGVFLELIGDQSASTTWPHDISVIHNTAFPVGSGTANIEVLQAPQELFLNFTFNNNIVGAGSYGLHNVLPGGGLPGCSLAASALATLNACMGSTWVFQNNVIAANSSNVPGSPYPTGTFLTTFSSVGFASYNNGNGGDYQLSPTSPYKNAGTDGKDLGADVSSLQAATSGVQ